MFNQKHHCKVYFKKLKGKDTDWGRAYILKLQTRIFIGDIGLRNVAKSLYKSYKSHCSLL